MINLACRAKQLLLVSNSIQKRWMNPQLSQCKFCVFLLSLLDLSVTSAIKPHLCLCDISSLLHLK